MFLSPRRDSCDHYYENGSQQAPTKNRRSRLWYSLLIFLCMIGGLTAYFVLTGWQSSVSAATLITINITAEVADIDDPDNMLGGAVEVGDTIKGSYTYDSTTPDSNPSSTVGDYNHSRSPNGIKLNVGEFLFRTAPNNVVFVVEIVNDHGDPASDNYLLRSYNNISDGPPVTHISWQLDDPTSTALSSTDLPTVPPVLTDWQSIFGLTIEGEDPEAGSGYFIRAHVTSATKRGRE
jgi:hypothetical protein